MGTICLITGGAGFIGSNITEELIRRGENVRILDNFATGKRENIASFREKIDIIEGDIRDIAVARKAVEGVEYVLHQAALPSVPRSINDPISTNAINVDGTLNMLVAARDAGVKRFVYASSSSVYGNTPRLPKREYMKPEPLSPYAISKFSGEQYCQAFYNIYGLETVILRYFNVFGPKQNPTSQYAAVIPKFIMALLNGRSITIYGDGEQSRDFTHVDNIVQANLLSCTTKGVAGEVFNIACEHRITINQLVENLKHLLNSNIEPVYTEPRIGEVKHSFADISKAERLLGYQPNTSFDEGLSRTVQWFSLKMENSR